MKISKILLLFSFIVFSCDMPEQQKGITESHSPKAQENKTKTEHQNSTRISFQTPYIATAFDYPVGNPNGKGYYNAQAFGKNNHLGDDWNAVTGGNSDLGDPIYVIANGYAKFAEDIGGGWGKVIRVVHQLPNGKTYESLYAHCDSILIKADTWLKKGEQIGTIGNANGQYYAHLHLEIRSDINLPIGGGYSTNQTGYLDPTVFIKKHRKVKND